jgi:hypothetical protein
MTLKWLAEHGATVALFVSAGVLLAAGLLALSAVIGGGILERRSEERSAAELEAERARRLGGV